MQGCYERVHRPCAAGGLGSCVGIIIMVAQWVHSSPAHGIVISGMNFLVCGRCKPRADAKFPPTGAADFAVLPLDATNGKNPVDASGTAKRGTVAREF